MRNGLKEFYRRLAISHEQHALTIDRHLDAISADTMKAEELRIARDKSRARAAYLRESIERRAQ